MLLFQSEEWIDKWCKRNNLERGEVLTIQPSLGAFQTLVSGPPVPGLSWTKHRTGCRDFQAGRFDVKVLVYSRKVMTMNEFLANQESNEPLLDQIVWVTTTSDSER